MNNIDFTQLTTNIDVSTLSFDSIINIILSNSLFIGLFLTGITSTLLIWLRSIYFTVKNFIISKYVITLEINSESNSHELKLLKTWLSSQKLI